MIYNFSRVQENSASFAPEPSGKLRVVSYNLLYRHSFIIPYSRRLSDRKV